MFNKNELLAELKRKGKTLNDLATFLGKDPATVSRKVNGHSEWTRSEIQAICAFLELDNPMSIFFADHFA